MQVAHGFNTILARRAGWSPPGPRKARPDGLQPALRAADPPFGARL